MLVDSGPSSLVKQYIPRISWWLYWGVIQVVSAVKYQGQFGSCRALSATQAVLSVGADFGWIPREALMSRTSSTITHGSYGCDDGWTEGAYVHLSTDADLAISFYIPCALCLTAC